MLTGLFIGFVAGAVAGLLIGRKNPSVADATAKIANQGRDTALKAAEDIKTKVG